LYLLTAQIFLGIYLLSQGLHGVPTAHFALALLAAVGYMLANGMVRKPGNERNALLISGISTVMILAAFALGLHAAGMI
jgi:hypothetical protein